ncbi:hypothetical protein [Vibrio sp. TBV020]|uniref:hypothetical protein n=1 Tax=Vibrio sp. TBV020 TaxID=3137398 RepID=UPI0038CD4BA6
MNLTKALDWASPPCPHIVQVWKEGYIDPGFGFVKATLVGEVEAKSLADAINKLTEDGRIHPQYLNPDKTAILGCRLFDNEREARAVFG